MALAHRTWHPEGMGTPAGGCMRPSPRRWPEGLSGHPGRARPQATTRRVPGFIFSSWRKEPGRVFRTVLWQHIKMQ